MNDIKKTCGMCEYSLPEPKQNRVYCRRFPPKIMAFPQVNPVLRRPEMIFASMLPEVLRDGVVCGEFKFARPELRTICDKKE